MLYAFNPNPVCKLTYTHLGTRYYQQAEVKKGDKKSTILIQHDVLRNSCQKSINPVRRTILLPNSRKLLCKNRRKLIRISGASYPRVVTGRRPDPPHLLPFSVRSIPHSTKPVAYGLNLSRQIVNNFPTLDLIVCPLWTAYITVMEGAASPAPRRVCHQCRVEKELDQFYDLRGNGRVVTKCLDCRGHQRASVRSNKLLMS